MPEHTPSTGLPLADELIRRTLRQARIAWVFAYLGLAVMAVSLWYLKEANATLTKVSAQLEKKDALLQDSAARTVEEILTEHSRPKTLASRDELVAYFRGDGKFALNRYIVKDEQEAFLAALAPDPSTPGRYEAAFTTAKGEKRVYVFDVVAAVQSVVK